MSSRDRLRIDPLALDGPSELHTWAQHGKSDQRHVRRRAAKASTTHRRWITITMAAGANAGEGARMVGEAIGWPSEPPFTSTAAIVKTKARTRSRICRGYMPSWR